MKKLKLLWNILRSTQSDKIVTGFIVFLVLVAFLIQLVEPGITSLQDALWYCFAVATSIGFGDITAVTMMGRILSVILSLYSILVLALIPAIIVSYFMEVSKIRAAESTMVYLEKLEHLDTLSKEELKELSEHIKKRKFKI